MRLFSRSLVVAYLFILAVSASGQEPDAVPSAVESPPPAATSADNGQKDKSPAGKRPNPHETRVSMSFEKADVNSVVKFLSMAGDVPIVCDPDLKGNVTIISLKQINLADAFEVVNAALRVRGYTMVGNLDSMVIRVVPMKKAIADVVEVRTGKDPGEVTAGDSMVTQVMTLEYANAVKMKDDLKPLVADDQANLVAIASTNTLIITDSAGNVHRIAEIVRELDKDTSDLIEIEIHQCKYSSADSLIETLLKIFPPARPSAPGQPGGRGGPPPQEGQPQPQVRGEDGLISLKGEIRIASDARTNSIIISASREKVNLVLDVLKRLDVDTEPEVRVETFPLQYADAKVVADQLNMLFEQPQGGAGGAARRFPWDMYGGGGGGGPATGYAGLKRNVVVADMRTNSVIVTATEQNMRAFREMIEKLDAPKVLSEITRYFPLKFARANELAETLNRLFRGETRRSGGFMDYLFGYGYNQNRDDSGPLAQLRNITVVPEQKTNSLLVTGPPNSFSVIEQLINDLDQRTAQVYIEVAIVDVTLDDETKFGVEWAWRGTDTASDGTPITQDATTEFGLIRETLGLKYSIISDNLRALLHALESKSNVRVLSTPSITTADNVQATISIGRDEPFVSSEIETVGGGFRRTVDFKKVAVALNVTPHVNGASDVVALDVHQTVNEVIGREPELGAPIIADREARTTITVRDGQTIVIGGIIKENRDRVTRAVPILSRIPLIGELFKSRQWRDEKSELMVFLTPHILYDDQDADDITQEVKDKLSVQPK